MGRRPQHAPRRHFFPKFRETRGGRPARRPERRQRETRQRISERTSARFRSAHGRAQKNVVAVVLVPLSQVIVTVQFRNFGTAGTILRSYLELAASAKP